MNLKSIFKIAGLIGLITILSKVIGFFRDVVIAGAYGASMESDAYFYAYGIPAITFIILGGLGGPFHTVTVSVFSKGKAEEKALNTFLNMTGIGFIVITIFVFFTSGNIAPIIAPGASAELHAMIAEQLKIMSPIIFVGGIVGILFGISNVYNKFLLTAISPMVSSIVIIAAIWSVGGKYGGLLLAWSTLIGAVLQLVIQMPAYFASGYKYRFDFDLTNEKVKKIGEILFPAILGCSIGQLHVFIDMFFASQLPEGNWSAIGYANRIFQFPAGVIITAMLVSIFPTLSQMVGGKDWAGLKYYVHKGLSSLWFVTFPVLIFMAVFSYEIITIMFQRGKFDHNATVMVTQALFYLSFAIVFYAGRDTLTRVFYAFDDTKTPFIIAFISLFIKAVLNFMLVERFGIGGITLSTVAISAINGLLLAILIRKKINLEFGKMMPDLGKIIIASVIMAIIAYGTKTILGQILGEEKFYMALNVMLSCFVASITYFVIAIVLKVETAVQFWGKTCTLIKKS